MIKFALALSTGMFLAWPGVSRADSYARFSDYVRVDPTGRFYAVVKAIPGGPADPGRGTPVEILLAERAIGASPAKPARGNGSPDVKVREGDTLHGRVELKRAPSQIVISSTGLGFVGLDVRGYNFAWPGERKRTDNAVVHVTQAGEVNFRKDTLDLFDAGEMNLFRATAGGVWWCGGGWFDDARKQFVIVSAEMESKPKQRLFRVLDLDSGELAKGGPEPVVTALKEVNRGALETALDLAAELELQAAQPHLPGILTDGELPPGVRSRAAVALAALGDFQGASYLSNIALETGDDYAVTHLPLLLQEKAAPVIRDVVARHGEKAEHAAWTALRSLEAAAAMPTLIAMLGNEQDPAGQHVAAEVVCSIGATAKQTIPALIAILEGKTVKDERHWRVETIACAALGSIGPDARDAIPALLRFRKRAELRLDEFRARQPDKGLNASGFDSNDFEAEYSYRRANEAIEEIDK